MLQLWATWLLYTVLVDLTDAIAETLRVLVGGDIVSSYKDGDERYDVILRAELADELGLHHADDGERQVAENGGNRELPYAWPPLFRALVLWTSVDRCHCCALPAPDCYYSARTATVRRWARVASARCFGAPGAPPLMLLQCS
jgi:hypothetical protein